MKQTTWHLENVREIAQENPYTYYVPSEELLELLEVGDLVKLLFHNDIKTAENKFEAERMWVEITQINGNQFVGKLDSQPYEITELKVDDEIHFEPQHIMGVYTKDDPVPSVANQYWDRCWTTEAILNGEKQIGFICRDEPIELKESEYQDSGWQILSGDETDEDMDNPQLIAIGKLLNLDDSFIHLLDSEIGSAYYKNEQGEWVADEEFKFSDETD